MKKILFLLLAATLLCASVFVLSACQKDSNDSNNNVTDTEDTVHTHNMTGWTVEVAATCTSAGKETRKCTDADCGHTETKTVPALGHDLTKHEKAASCTEPGYHLYEDCSRCDYTTYDTSKDIPVKSHTYENGVCKDCEYEHNHTYSTGWTPVGSSADCTQGATEQRECDGCDFVDEREVGKTDHSYGLDNVCTECGHVKTTAPELPDDEF